MTRAALRLQHFAGRWRIARRIKDALGPDAQFDGEANFAREGAALLLTEAGQMRIGAQSFAATRRYLWRQGAGSVIDVLFDDGRYFHSFDAAMPEPAAHHDCPPDVYDVGYDFTGLSDAAGPTGLSGLTGSAPAPQWHARWRVTGPRKDYVMTSTYTRILT